MAKKCLPEGDRPPVVTTLRICFGDALMRGKYQMAKKFVPDPEDRRLITTVRICFSDAIVKGGTGALIGTLMSMCFMNRKRWPIIIGLGIGMGFSWANCQ